MRKHYTAKMKAQIVLEILREEKSISQLSSEYGIHANQLYKWKAQALERLPGIFENDHKTKRVAHERQLEELYAEIGKLSTQLAWLKNSGIEPVEK